MTFPAALWHKCAHEHTFTQRKLNQCNFKSKQTGKEPIPTLQEANCGVICSSNRIQQQQRRLESQPVPLAVQPSTPSNTGRFQSSSQPLPKDMGFTADYICLAKTWDGQEATVWVGDLEKGLKIFLAATVLYPAKQSVCLSHLLFTRSLAPLY